MTKLLPCPFCGGEPYKTPSGPAGFVIRCGSCSARTVSDVGAETAEKEWNARTELPPEIYSRFMGR